MSLLKRFSRRASDPVPASTSVPHEHLQIHDESDSADATPWPVFEGAWPAHMLEEHLTRQSLIEQAKTREWFHTIDFGGGQATPGPVDAQVSHQYHAFKDVDFTNKSVLDIGCWDGLWSYEAEKRGAREIYSTDLISQRDGDVSNYRLAHSIFNSKAQYKTNVSVYDVHTLGKNDFDVVLYMGVFYHIKDPLLALARLRQVMKVGGQILVEGEVVRSEKSYGEFYYNEDYARSASNWWIPSIGCLREWVQCSYFEIEKEYDERHCGKTPRNSKSEYGRYLITARALPIPKLEKDDPKNFFSRYDFLDELAV
ncbi:class I SAM-dependent methyltransferase [Singulisphaera sp. PoT]|uniref:class I SAM-dependent methyltransferase n=1 Tax=Singulisphaera sp. PoT TaxID=3411797 RepID=UPI003BF48BC8